MPSPAWRRWPRRAGCGGDPSRIRPGSVERHHPLIRVGGDAHIAPGPDGQDRWDDTYKPPALAPDLPGGCGHPPLRGWEVFATQPGPAYTFMCPLHTRRLRAAPSPSRRGHELLVLGCRKIYGIATTVCALSRNDISSILALCLFETAPPIPNQKCMYSRLDCKNNGSDIQRSQVCHLSGE